MVSNSDKMTLNNFVNYVMFDNPLCKKLSSYVTGNSKTMDPSTIKVVTERVPLYKLAGENGPFIKIAGLMGASAVILAAYGAHRAYDKDSPADLRGVYETGSRMHFFHTLALMGVPMCKRPNIAATLFVSGTILFCGPCYYHAFTAENKFGRLAPVGGTILIFAWLSMIF